MKIKYQMTNYVTEIQYENNFQLKIKIKQKIFHFKLHKNILYNDTTFSTKNSIRYQYRLEKGRIISSVLKKIFFLIELSDRLKSNTKI